MAGHSQFKNIMHKKGKQDAIRSKLFGKFAREITVAAKWACRTEHERPLARRVLAPAPKHAKDNIERAIKKARAPTPRITTRCATRAMPRRRRDHHRGLTDNRNRTAGEVRSNFTKAGAPSRKPGRVLHVRPGGLVEFDRKVASEDAIMEAAIDAGARMSPPTRRPMRSSPRSKVCVTWPKRWRRNSATRRKPP